VSNTHTHTHTHTHQVCHSRTRLPGPLLVPLVPFFSLHLPRAGMPSVWLVGFPTRAWVGWRWGGCLFNRPPVFGGRNWIHSIWNYQS
jgi:hypothetical protein